ncbi:tyrosine-type recombinase/integrase [Sphingobacterium siyangense]|uniref:tyrosine-type recombinase/integrase n=1 Tax=Sphingobacterium siyangense TaxID=459529 RepID=UPI003DA56888
MSLSDLACRKAMPESKPYRLYDTNGLYLEVLPTGKRVWRLKYRIYAKDKTFTLGHYPELGLVQAREQRDSQKEAISLGNDPSAQKQEHKRLATFKAAQTFEAVAREWHTRNFDTWTEKHAGHIIRRLEQNVFKSFGSKPIAEVNIQDTLACLQKVEDRGCIHMAKRIKQIIGQVLRYAVVTGRADRDFTPDLRGALKRYRPGHFATIESEELPALIQTIEQNKPRLFRQTIIAIKLLMLTFVRTNELINATWQEFDLEKRIWRIPAERMKMRKEHIVPLSHQVMVLLSELQELFGNRPERPILPSVIRRTVPISNNTILSALDSLGYKYKMTGHGFRALAMTTIKENMSYRHEVIDRQLAHAHKNKIQAAYDRAQFLKERTQMMQDWADYIDRVVLSAKE